MHLLSRPSLLAAAMACAFFGSQGIAQAEPLQVVASFSIIGDFASNVGGDRVQVQTLVPVNGDAHVYEPKPTDVIAFKKADLILENGLQFDPFMQRLAKASETKAPVVTLTQGVTPLKNAEAGHDHDAHGHDHGDHEHEHEHASHAEKAPAAGHGHHDHGEYDPHAWQSVPNAEIYVKNTADALCKVDAAGCETYKANAAAYTAKLQALDKDIRARIDTLPKDRRNVITSHDAFGYLGSTYGLTFLAPEGTSSDTEASAADVAAIIRQVRQDKGAAIFMENISNPALIKQISTEGGVGVGGKLYSDALSGPNEPAATYLGMMQYNVDTIVKAILKQ